MLFLVLDCRDWRTVDDAWAGLLGVLDAPGWHGRNLDALHDSLGGGINGVAVPFALTLTGWRDLPAKVAGLLDGWAMVFADAPDAHLDRA